MSWIKLIYYPRLTKGGDSIKTHVVESSLEEIFTKNVLDKYGILPEERAEVAELSIDPGGMLCLFNQPIKAKIESRNISIKPEHILFATKAWTNKNEIANNAIRVYLSDHICAGVTTDLYYKIGAWLVNNYAVGYAARMDMVELFKVDGRDEHIIISPPPTNMDA